MNTPLRLVIHDPVIDLFNHIQKARPFIYARHIKQHINKQHINKQHINKQHINFPIPGYHIVYASMDAGNVRHVHMVDGGLTAVRNDQISQYLAFFHGVTAQRHLSAGIGQPLTDGRSDAASRTGHQNGLPVQSKDTIEIRFAVLLFKLFPTLCAVYILMNETFPLLSAPQQFRDSLRGFFYLAVIHGIAVQAGLDQLIPQLIRIGESGVCQGLLIQHPLAVLVHIFLRLQGQPDTAAIR